MAATMDEVLAELKGIRELLEPKDLLVTVETVTKACTSQCRLIEYHSLCEKEPRQICAEPLPDCKLAAADREQSYRAALEGSTSWMTAAECPARMKQSCIPKSLSRAEQFWRLLSPVRTLVSKLPFVRLKASE